MLKIRICWFYCKWSIFKKEAIWKFGGTAFLEFGTIEMFNAIVYKFGKCYLCMPCISSSFFKNSAVNYSISPIFSKF